MLTYRYPLIAREGWPWIGLVAAIALAVQWQFGWIAVPLWLLAAGMLFVYRDPARRVPASPLGVVSPVDGRVLSVETRNSVYLQKTAVCISIQMSMSDIFSVRSPMEGKVQQQWLGTGKESGTGPRYAQWIQSDEADDVVLVIAPGVTFLYPHCYVQSGERVGQGQRCGFVHFGGRVEVWVPSGSRIAVRPGDTLQAGSDIIAVLVHEKVVPPKATPRPAVKKTPKVDTDPVSSDH